MTETVGRFQTHVYEGLVDEQQQPHGKGKLTVGNTVFEGEFLHGKMHGFGRLVRAYGDEYEGEFRDNLYHGKGVLISKEHYGLLVQRYEGQFEKGMKSGSGKLLMSSSASYEGGFYQDKFHGKGVLKSGPRQLSGRNGYSYDGEWDSGKIHGYGTESYPSGARYEGKFYNGRKHGYGKYSGNGLTNGGYTYEGQWVNGIRQGLGLELNRPIERIESTESGIRPRNQRTDLKLPFLYEGEFWNNKRHGLGRYISENGQIYYGGWVNGLKSGIGCEINPVTKVWEVKLWHQGEYVRFLGIKGDSEATGDVYTGYDYWMDKVHQVSGEPYDDKEFPPHASSYPHFDIQKMQEVGIDYNALKFVRLRDIYPEKMVCVPLPGNLPIKIELPRFYDNQLLPFLFALLRSPQHTLDVLNHSTITRYLFFCFNMYLEIQGHILKSFIAVDDCLPLSQDGINLFSQLERGENVILPMLEKAWYKYVNICKIKQNLHRGKSHYIDKVMFAFLGAPSITLNTSAPDFIGQLHKYYQSGAYIFCYLRDSTKTKQSSLPFQLVELIQVNTTFNSASRSPEAFVLQSIDNTNCPGKTERIDLVDPVSHGKYLTDKESGYFISHWPDFQAYYSEVKVCLFDPELKPQFCSFSVPTKQLKETGFEEFYFTARVPVCDRLKLSVWQDHEMDDEGAVVELLADQFGGLVKDLQAKKNPPIRLLLARSPTLNHSKIGAAAEAAAARPESPGKLRMPSEMRPTNKKRSKTPKKQRPDAIEAGSMGFLGGMPLQPQDSLESIEQSSDEETTKREGGKRDKSSKSKKTAKKNKRERSPGGVSGELTDAKAQEKDKDEERVEFVKQSYRRKYKYVDGVGQSRDECIVLGEQLIEGGIYTLMIQVQTNKEYTAKLKNLNFKITAQSRSGNVYFEPCQEKPHNFMQNVYSELALRKAEKEKDVTKLESVSADGKHKRIYQYFSKSENVYAQLFVNMDSNHVWIHKLRPSMHNMEVIGVKNQKKPVELRIEPFQEKIMLIQQINAGEFEFIGGDGDFTLQKVKKL